MKLDLTQAIDESIAMLRAGATIEICLKRYPQFAHELQPVLRLAVNLQTLEILAERSESIQAGRQRLLNAYSKKMAVQPVSKSFFPRYLQRITIRLTGKDDINMKLVARFAFALLLVVGLIIGGGVTSTASARALPGDTLYPVKLGLENLQLLFVNDAQARQQLELQFQTTRQQEVQSILQLGRQTDVHFAGVLSAVYPDGWIIGGLPVRLDSSTQINGATVIGSVVNVEGRTQADGTILAHMLIVLGGANAPRPGSTPMPYPSKQPTMMPSQMPTRMAPTMMPSQMPTRMPSKMPTMMQPTMRPPTMPTSMPTMMPPTMPSRMPTMMGPRPGMRP